MPSPLARTVVTPYLYILHGPNLNMLGVRDPALYGTDTLLSIEQNIRQQCRESGFSIHTFQTNHEGMCIDYIQNVYTTHKKNKQPCILLVNLGAWSHTSVACRDAILLLVEDPDIEKQGFLCLEVHLSNIYQRENFRHVSYVPAHHCFTGFGSQGYSLAIQYARCYTEQWQV
jgi:3-dehydroquinate dehydratase II